MFETIVKKYHFEVDTGYVGSVREEEVSIVFDVEEYEDEAVRTEIITEVFTEWLEDNTTSYWEEIE